MTPAGKSTRRLSLLSGGEKSLVALAFVFAVLMARPCPFYILDEVEAALDDINIDRFLRLVRRFAERSQFIVVTHQKRTMDAADILYGVSMGGDGDHQGRLAQAAARRARHRDGTARGHRGRRSRSRLASQIRRRCLWPPFTAKRVPSIRSRACRLPGRRHSTSAIARSRDGRAGRGASWGLPAPSQGADAQPPGSDRGALLELHRADRRVDLGAPRGGADPRRRRRPDHGRGRAAARGRGRGRGADRRRGPARTPDRRCSRRPHHPAGDDARGSACPIAHRC